MKFSNGIKLSFVFVILALPHVLIAAQSDSKNSKKSASPANGIYRNVNEDGVVEFSDQGFGSSEKIKLKSTNTFKSAEKKITPQPVVNNESNETDSHNVIKYTTVSISSPTPDQQIRSNDGLLSVSISVTPSLNTAAGDQIELYLDGRSQGKQTSSQFSLKEVYRGQHRIQAKIINKSGTVMEISNPVQFVIHKFSILSKSKAKGK